MTISRVGTAIAEADSIAIPAHQVGDLIIISAYRIGSGSVAAPSGWFSPGAAAISSGVGRVLGAKWAQSTSEVSGTWTGANFLNCMVYRSDVGFVVPGNLGAAVSSATNTLAFAALAMRNTSGDAWVMASAIISQVDTDIETPPTGLTAIQNLAGSVTVGEAALYDTDGPVSSFAAITRTMSGTAGNVFRYHMELFELPYLVAGGSTTHNPFRSRAFGAKA
jgi:hypothetical protein